MKRRYMWFSSILCICLLFTSVQAAFASSNASMENQPTVFINADKHLITGAILSSGKTMVPAKEFFAVWNIKPLYDNKMKTVTAKDAATAITLTVGKKTAILNGKEVQLAQAPKIEAGTMYVNLRFLTEAFGGTIQFDKKSVSVNVDFQHINVLTKIWANALKSRDGKPRFDMMSDEAKEKFKQQQINRSGENWNYIIGDSSPWVTAYEVHIRNLIATITYVTKTSEPAYYQTKEMLTFIEKNGQLIVDDYETIFENKVVE